MSRPLMRGDVLRVFDKRFERLDTWIVKRIQLHVLCLNGGTGVLLEQSNGMRQWVAFPNDPYYEIVDRLAN